MNAVLLSADRVIYRREDTLAAWCGIIWFNLIIDACYTWFIPDVVRNVVGTLIVVFATAVLAQKHGVSLSRQRRGAFFAVFVLASFMIVVKFHILDIFIFLPLLCIIQWRESALARFYDFFKKYILFYAILSILIEILVVTKQWLHLPLIAIFEPHDYVQESLGYVNFFYGFFCIPAADTSLTFYRACGPLREGGHFIFYLCFVYLAELTIFQRRNKWLILCGMLTLSPNFILLFSLAEFYNAIKEKRILKPLLVILGILFAAMLLFLLSPQMIKDEIILIIYERMLEESIENMGTDGVMALLDGRAGEGIVLYNNFLHSSLIGRLVGTKFDDSGAVLSDYRYMFMYCGYLGTAMLIWCMYQFSFPKRRNFFGLCVFIIAFAAFVQRAWMFRQVYFFIMMLLVTTEYNLAQRNRQENLQ